VPSRGVDALAAALAAPVDVLPPTELVEQAASSSAASASVGRMIGWPSVER
jgi:hypothetical protein